MGALVTPLFTLCNPGVALWFRVNLATTHAWWVSASVSNVARMHAMLVLWALSMLLCTLAIPDAYGTSIACILATLLMLALTHHAPCLARSNPNPNPKPKSYTRVA